MHRRDYIFFFSFLLAAISSAEEVGNLQSGSVESGLDMPSPPTLTPSTPAPATNDRAKSSAAAVAFAMGAAAQQKMACFMMMSEAMKEKDPSTKAMMQAMAMQQCAQADESMANAYKNKEGQKLVSGSDIPKQASIQGGTSKLGKDRVTEAEVPHVFIDSGADKTTSDGVDPVSLITKPDEVGLPENPKKPGAEDLKDPIDQFIKEADLNPNSLEAIAAIEAPKGTPATTAPNTPGLGLGLGLGGTMIGSRSVASDDGKKVAADGTASFAASRESKTTTAESGSGEGSSEPKASFDFQALMEQMMGPQASQDVVVSGEFTGLPFNVKKKEDRVNLFQYASYRYRKLVTEKKALRSGKPKVARLKTLSLEQKIASVEKMVEGAKK